MRTERVNKGIGKGLPSSSFEDDGIPNSPFKSSKSAAVTLAMFGVVFGGLLVISGAYFAFKQSATVNAPVQVVQQIQPATPPRAVPHAAPVTAAVATVNNARKRYHHANKQAKNQSKSKQTKIANNH